MHSIHLDHLGPVASNTPRAVTKSSVTVGQRTSSWTQGKWPQCWFLHSALLALDDNERSILGQIA